MCYKKLKDNTRTFKTLILKEERWNRSSLDFHEIKTLLFFGSTTLAADIWNLKIKFLKSYKFRVFQDLFPVKSYVLFNIGI